MSNFWGQGQGRSCKGAHPWPSPIISFGADSFQDGQVTQTGLDMAGRHPCASHRASGDRMDAERQVLMEVWSLGGWLAAPSRTDGDNDAVSWVWNGRAAGECRCAIFEVWCC